MCHINGEIKCASCGKSIIPGDPITLQPKKMFNVTEHFAIHNGKLVCCFRKPCRHGRKIDGYWIKPGKVDNSFYTW